MSDRRREVWEAFKTDVINDFGMKRFQALSGRYKLKTLFRRWWKLRDAKAIYSSDVPDVATAFRGFAAMYVEPLSGRIRGGDGTHVPYLLTYGSMLSISAYADTLPIVVKARTEVLGSKEALEHSEAVRWLDAETSGPGGLALVEVTYRFLVPRTAQLVPMEIAGAAGEGTLLLGHLDGCRRPSRLAAGIKHPSITHSRRTVTVRDGEARREISLADRGSEKLETLVLWGNRLADRCVGATPREVDAQPAGFEWAVWLILTGVWPRILTYSTLKGKRAVTRDYGTDSCERASPYMQMNILALDAPPKEIADSYQSLRSALNLGRTGPKLDAESEILCLAALEAKEIDGLGIEDRGRFRDAVLKRFVAKAELHGVVPTRFTGAGAWERARRVLRRAEKTYANLFPPSDIPVHTPEGPRKLIADEPTLFSKEREVTTRLV